MAGLAKVHDGSKHQQGLGYLLCNVTGVDESGRMLVPAYSELYSLVEESSSENIKIPDAIDLVSQIVGEDKIWVDDRGGDRKGIMEPLLQFVEHSVLRYLTLPKRCRALVWIV